MINNLDLAWQKQEVIPTLITGNGALLIYSSLPEQIRVDLRYDENSKTVIGSTPFAVTKLNFFVENFGARTPNLRDLSRPEVMEIVKGKFYVHARNLVARSLVDVDCFMNNLLLQQIYELVEEREGSIKEPFMIEGFNFFPNSEDKIGYGLNIVAGPNFKVISDERFDVKYNRSFFSEVDELGIPKFDEHGNRLWYTKKKGLSSLELNGALNLYSNNESLKYSNKNGRIILLKECLGEK